MSLDQAQEVPMDVIEAVPVNRLCRIARALADRLPSVDSLPLIAQEARIALGAETVVIALLEDEGFLRFRAVAGEREAELLGVRLRAVDSFAERTLRTGEAELLLPTDTLSDPSLPAASTHIPSSVASAPIQVGGEPKGALLAMRGEAMPSFSDDDLSMSVLIADMVAAALTSDESERVRAEQSRELSILHKASRSVGASLNLRQILDSVLEAVCEHVDFQTAVVLLANDENTLLFVAAERGLAEADREIQFSTDCPLIAQILTTNCPRVFTRAEELPELEVFTRDDRIRAAMVAPIINREHCHGVLLVTSPQPENFTENDLKLLEAVAAQAGTAISNAWLYEDASQRAEQTGALYDLSQRLNSTLDPGVIHDLAVGSARSLLNVDSAAILTRDERTGKLVGTLARGIHADGLLNYQAACNLGVAGWVLEWETPQAVAHVEADPRNTLAPLDTMGIRSVMAAPLSRGDQAHGVLLAASGSRRLFTVSEMELLYTVANQASASLMNAEMYAEARRKSAEMRRYFRRLARALGESVAGEDVPRLFVDLALAMMRGAVCNIYVVEGNHLALRVSSAYRGHSVPNDPLPMEEGFTGTVARRGQIVVSESAAADPRIAAHPWAARLKLSSYVGVPVRNGHGVFGVVEVFAQEPLTNPRDEARLLAQFARLARLAERIT